MSDMTHNSNAPSRKLGFGLVGSGKRTTVPSVFHEEEDEDAVEKKLRPLVPIDYSTEEIQEVKATASVGPSNLLAAAEFAKRISNVNPKEEKPESETERSRLSYDISSRRKREQNEEENNHKKVESRWRVHDKTLDRENDQDKLKMPENKHLDAKKLIDMIPKTKEELFAYDINWAVYDKVRCTPCSVLTRNIFPISLPYLNVLCINKWMS